MSSITDKEKKSLKDKFLEIQRLGLVSYGKYLEEQADFASKSDLRKAYGNYVKGQIELNNKRIADIDSKLP